MDQQQIAACFIAQKYSPHIFPSLNNWRPQLDTEWTIINKNLEKIFSLVDHFSTIGLQTMKFRMLDYDVTFYPIIDWTIIFVVVTPKEVPQVESLQERIEQVRQHFLTTFKRKNFGSKTTFMFV